MTQEQPTPIDTRSDYGRAARRAARTQERHERWLAKQAAREARRAARAQRPHRDWSFEVRVGDQVHAIGETCAPVSPKRRSRDWSVSLSRPR